MKILSGVLDSLHASRPIDRDEEGNRCILELFVVDAQKLTFQCTGVKKCSSTHYMPTDDETS
jgi:hypothetical protein